MWSSVCSLMRKLSYLDQTKASSRVFVYYWHLCVMLVCSYCSESIPVCTVSTVSDTFTIFASLLLYQAQTGLAHPSRAVTVPICFVSSIPLYAPCSVWNIQTGQILNEFYQHKNSAAFLKFNTKLVITGSFVSGYRIYLMLYVATMLSRQCIQYLFIS